MSKIPTPLKTACATTLLALLTFMEPAYGQKADSRTLSRILEKSETLKNSFTGFVLYDPATQKTLFSQHGEKYFTPASNTKLFSFYAGLKILGDSLPALRYMVRGDSLVFWATADPSFLNSDLEGSPAAGFLKSRPEKLYYWEVPHTIGRFGPGWSWGDYPYYYSTERAPFPIYANNAVFTTAGHPDSLTVSPRYFARFTHKDYSPEPGTRGLFSRPETENRFVYHVKNDTQAQRSERFIPFVYSKDLFLALLQDTLRRHVGEYASRTPLRGQVLYSIPADTLYRHMLQSSDNFYAEQLLLMCASAVSDTLSAETTIDYVKKNYLAGLPDDIRWRDGSGLSRYNLFTPRTITALLDSIYRTVDDKTRLFGLFPAGGQSGTLKSVYKSENGNPPFVYAKTGTLGAVHCLSGYLMTKKGKTLIFSFMHNQYVVPTSDIRDEMDKVLRLVRDTY